MDKERQLKPICIYAWLDCIQKDKYGDETMHKLVRVGANHQFIKMRRQCYKVCNILKAGATYDKLSSNK